MGAIVHRKKGTVKKILFFKKYVYVSKFPFEMMLLPNSFSVSFLALPATLPPRLATFLCSGMAIGFSLCDISVVTLSAQHGENQLQIGHVIA